MMSTHTLQLLDLLYGEGSLYYSAVHRISTRDKSQEAAFFRVAPGKISISAKLKLDSYAYRNFTLR